MSEGERIAKFLSRAGVASRRAAARQVADGRGLLNNVRVDHPATFVTEADTVAVDGRVLDRPGRARLWRYHKPEGLVTTHKDPEGRPTVFERLPPGLPRVMSVGRLDLNSEGLLLLTDDGGLKRQLELPANGWIRRYRARVWGHVDEGALRRLADGITLDGQKTGPIEAGLDSQRGENAWLTVALREGRYREVRRVLATMGLQVTRLIRVSYGPFLLGQLKPSELEEVNGKVLGEQIGSKARGSAP